MASKLEANIWKFYVIAGLSGFVLYYVLDKVFMNLRGLSVTEIILVEIVFSVTVLLFEVPSGALADRWSRKNVLVLNEVFFILNTLIWVLSHSLTFFILGAIAGAIHMALVSGTFTSMVYDTLRQLGREHEYEKIYGSILFYGGILGVAAGILGGMIAAQFGITIPFWLTIGVIFTALLITILLQEPQIHRTTGEMDYWKHIANTFRFVSRHPFLRHLAAIMAIISATFFLMDEYMQLYFVSVGVPIFFLGYLGGLANTIGAFAGRFSYLLNRFSRRNVYSLFILISAIGFLLTAYFGSPVGIAFTFLPILATFAIMPLLLSDLHRELSSSQRATGESFVNFLKALMFIPLGFLFGYFSDHVSIFVAYGSVGVVLSFYFLFYFLVSYRRIPDKREFLTSSTR